MGHKKGTHGEGENTIFSAFTRHLVHSSEPVASSRSFHTYLLLHFPQSPGSRVESGVAAMTSCHGPLPFVASTVPTTGGDSMDLTPPTLRPLFPWPRPLLEEVNGPSTHFLLAPDTPPTRACLHFSSTLSPLCLHLTFPCLHCPHSPHPPTEPTRLLARFTEKIKVS